jgi:hypothetical protein
MRKLKVRQECQLDPWTLFLNAMRAPMIRDRYQTTVAKFFEFIGIPGKTLEQKARTFANTGKNNTNLTNEILHTANRSYYCQKSRIFFYLKEFHPVNE